MKKPGITVSAAMLILFASASIAGAQSGTSGKLIGNKLHKTVAGKTIYMKTRGVVLPIRYRSNGTMSGKLQAVVALLAPNTPKADRGKWWINSNRLCQRWNHWLDHKSYCYRLKRDGKTVHWTRNDGRTGTARLGR